MKPCVAIPAYNHRNGLEVTLLRLLPMGYPVIVVNDGSTDGTAELLEQISSREDHCFAIHRSTNGGKGAAVKDAVAKALSHGFTHLVQVDADGQHELSDVEKLIAASRANEGALVCGMPQFGPGAPRIRVWGRELSNLLVWLETRSFQVRDVLCGFRVYPIHWCHGIVTHSTVANRMDFDLEVVVRLCWAGARVVNVPTRVSYPLDGISHYRYVADNINMIKLHLRLLRDLLAAQKIPKMNQ